MNDLQLHSVLPAATVLLVLLVLASSDAIDTAGYTNSTNMTSSEQHAITTDSSNSTNSSCPAWLLEYEQLHAAMRGKPGTKYLVHEVAGLAGGLGDRLRGMMFSVRAAYALKRVVLFTWQHPADVTAFLRPPPNSSINWTLDGIGRQHGKVLQMIDSTKPDISNGALLELKDEFLTFHTNAHMDTPCHSCPALDPWSMEAACLWQKLFRPNQNILDAAAEQLRSIYNTSDTPNFVAVHLRLGGLTGEGEARERGTGNGPMANWMAAVECASKLAQESGINTTAVPILIAADNHQLRGFLSKRYLSNVVAPAGDLPVHLDRARTGAAQHHVSTFVDMVLLGEQVQTIKYACNMHML